MGYVPVPPRPSSRSQELGRRLAEVIEQYRREHPDLTGFEERQALRCALRRGEARPAMIALVAGVLAFLIGSVVYYQKSGPQGGRDFPLVAFLVLLAALVLWVVFVRLRR